jgi:teichuronic acid biosynthesis protein TuaE
MVSFLDRFEFHNIARILVILVYPAGLLGMVVFSFPLGPIQVFPYRILMPIIWLVVMFLVKGNKVSLRNSLDKVRLFILFLLVWLIYAVISMSWAIDTSDALRHIISLLLSFSLIAFSVVFLESINDLYVVLIIWLALLGLSMLVGVIETYEGIHLPVSRYYQIRYRVPTAFFYNQNDFATFLSLSSSFLFSFILFSRKIPCRVLSILSSFLLFYMMIATGSRANYLAIIMVILYFIGVALASGKFSGEIILLIFGLLLLGFIFSDRLIDEFTSLLSSLQSISNPLVNPSKRINLIRNGFSFLGSTWGFGVGAGNFESWMQTRSVFDTGHIINAHNWFLELLVNYGVIIFIGYILFFLSLIFQIYRVLRTHWDDHYMKVVGVGILGSMVGFPLASLSPSSFARFRPHWLLFALALAYINIGLLMARKQAKPTNTG